ncbi:MAG: PilZ domain-containing protein [Candidatus Omnitrophota bacterium]
MQEYTGTEKRRSPRVDDGIRIRIFDKNIRTPVPVINISRHGALIRTSNLPNLGEMLDLSLFLPTEGEPIGIKGRVVRIVTICSAWGFRRFNIGIEFISIVETQRKKLAKTVEYLLKKDR